MAGECKKWLDRTADRDWETIDRDWETTVNFNINTLDASGFDDLLVRNRGTITQIINNAVNERGSKNLI